MALIMKSFFKKILKRILNFRKYKFDLVSKPIEILKPELSKSYKNSLDKLIKEQKNTRKFAYFFNYIFKFISDEYTNRLHLIY